MAVSAPPDPSVQLDPAILSYLQGNLGDQSAQVQQPAPISQPTSVQLPPEVAAAAQNGFSPQSLPPTPVVAPVAPMLPEQAPVTYQAPPDLRPVQATSTPQDVAKANAAIAKQHAQAAQQAAKQAAYAATPEGMEQAATTGQVAEKSQEGDITVQQGNVASQQAQNEEQLRQQNVADQAALNAKQQAAFEQTQQAKMAMFSDAKTAVNAAAQKVDPDRKWKSYSTGQKTGAIIGMLLAGIGQAFSGQQGANPVLKMLTDETDRDIDAQKSDIEQSNKKVQQLRDLSSDYGHITDDQNQHYDLLKAQQRVALGDKIEASAAHYGSPKALLNAQQAKAQLQGQADTIIGDYASKRIAQKHQDAELANQRAQTGIAAGHLSLAQKQFDWTKIKDQEDIAEKYLTADAKEKDKAKKVVDEDRDLGVKVPTGVQKIAAPDGTVQINPTADYIRNADGSVYHVPEKLSEKVMPKIEAARNTIDALDKATTLRSKNGGAVFDTESARALLQQVANAQTALQEEGGSARVSDATLNQALKRITGGADPNAVIKSVLPALKQAREDQEDRLNNTLKTYGNYDGKRVHIFDPNEDAEKPIETPSDIALKQAVKKTGIEDFASEERGTLDPNAPDYWQQLGQANERARQRVIGGDITEPQRQVLTNLISTAHAGRPSDAKTAMAQLKQIANSDTASESMRNRAQNALVVINAQVAGNK